ncbi:amino acid transporter AVT1J-like [Actinia tenebrosa]|uniref:Amino acid transporter AVT1J-like n=1 Tax=Actinia tenebrosa TaxID=6105 RepID=A0A6P8IKV5_ACTTE|nr:amino acid transporter AVT1J-like [Actinia tenebrosa]
MDEDNHSDKASDENEGEIAKVFYKVNNDSEELISGSRLHNVDEPAIIELGGQPQLGGLTIFTAAVFVVGEMAGSGVLALPSAMVAAGPMGFVMLLIGCLASGYCGVILGRSWTILRAKYPEYQHSVRDPYPTIGLKAVGKWGARAVSVCVNITLIGVCTVFLILAAQNISKLLTTHIHDVWFDQHSLRVWILICAAVLLPVSWLGTPKEFWGIAIGASLATALACLLICVCIGIDFPSNLQTVKQGPVTFLSFFSAFGTILFSFGGASTFPTIQTDMKQPSKFPMSVVWSYVGVLFMYLPVSILGFLAYGGDIKDNILLSVSHTSSHPRAIIVDIVLVLITTHLLFSFVIVLNPVSQYFEEFFNIPRRFGFKRCLLRTIIMALVLGIAELIPNFGPILSLIGGSTVTLLTFVFPCWFYLKIAKDLPLHTKAVLFELIFIGIVGGVASTYSAIDSIQKAFKL